jgi:MFS family permease
MTLDPQTAEEVPLEAHAEVAHRRRGLFFVGLAVGCMGFAFALLIGANSNFVGEEMGLSGQQQGVLEAVRETCGIIALLVLAMLSGFPEPLVGAAMLVFVGMGLGAYNWVPDYTWLVMASLVWSQGLHVWMPLPNSMTLALAEPGRAGRRVGQIRAAGAAGSGIGLVVGLGLSYLGVTIRPLFLFAGGAAVAAAVACVGIPRRIKTPGPRLVLRRSYRLYYLLSFLEGWRKQIFVAFAGFLLVKHHNVKLEDMLWLHIAIHAVMWLASPMVGRLIDRVGERKVLVFYFACLTVFFLGYAYVRDVNVLCGLFVLDSAFFVFALALTTYVNRIAPKSEHTATLSMGVAFNHVAAVLMPLVGAALWKYAGYQWVFVAGAAAAALSVPAALCLPKHSRDAEPADGAV